jgi:T-complex protein 10 C-terminus
LRLGNEWTISIVNFSSRGSASGVILIEYPAPVRKLADLALDQRSAIMRLLGKKPAGGKTEQRILPDGSIEIHYPDGRIVRIHGDGCGRTIIFPDGSSQQLLCSQVQPGNPPPLPSDQTLVAWLNSYNDNLLATIQAILQNDQASIDNLNNVESGKPLLEVIRLRIRFVGALAGALATEP